MVVEKTIQIVFDDFPNPAGVSFIEVEDEDGKSVRVGHWVEREDGTVALILKIIDE